MERTLCRWEQGRKQLEEVKVVHAKTQLSRISYASETDISSLFHRHAHHIRFFNLSQMKTDEPLE